MLTFTLRVLYQALYGTISPPKISPVTRTVDVAFRCWPIDLDAFLHMNNSRYLQNAELARWRTVSAGGKKLRSRFSSEEGMLFLAVENRVKYLRPIAPFERYSVSTTCTVDSEDDKYVYYRHVFEQHPDDVVREVDGGGGGGGGVPLRYAVIDLKAVVKQRNGVTIRPSTLIKESKFYKEWITQKEVDVLSRASEKRR